MHYMKRLSLPLFFLLSFVFSNPILLAISDDDLRNSPLPPRRRPNVTAERVSSEAGRGNLLMEVSFSERFLNERVKSYISPQSPLEQLYLAFNPTANRIVLRGTISLPRDLLAENGLEAELGRISFQSALRVRVSKKGYFAFIFPRDATSLWPASISRPGSDQRVRLPVEFLDIALAQVRCYLAALSGDFSSFERRDAHIAGELREERAKLGAAEGLEREKLEISVEELELKRRSNHLKLKRLKILAREQDSLVSFLSEREIDLNSSLKGSNNAIMIALEFQDMFPFLYEVGVGGVDFIKSGNKRYMKLEIISK